MRSLGKVVGILGIATGIYTLTVRPRILRWGATDDEVKRPYPGADLIPNGSRSATMAVTINATPEEVWPWLAQMGTDRGGWYSWDRLDNWGRRSVEQIHPEWQSIKLGDRMSAMPDGSQWWDVAALEPGRFLALRMSLDLRGRPFDPAGPQPRFFTDSTWCFLLEPLPDGKTRLVESGYWEFQPRWLQPIMSVLFLEPEHWIMQIRQFANLKRLSEGSRKAAADTAPAAELTTVGAGSH